MLVEGSHLTARERVEAGDALGRLGDPRPGVGVVSQKVGVGTLPDILWVEIPAGPFLMGSAEDDEVAYDNERPQHELDLPSFYIARYPITNAQFRPFVEGDGYNNSDYWTEQGWAWRHGAEPDLSVWDDYHGGDFKQRYRKWLSRRPVGRRDRPFWWEDSRWNIPTRPVVGITWFEAVAYTRWLHQVLENSEQDLKIWQAGQCKTLSPETLDLWLPSEAEWEKAARGIQGQRYPWGDSWCEDCANVEITGLKQTNPVGIFPEGSSPYCVMEMAGNVLEWTRSRWGERSVRQADYCYPYDPRDGREQLEEMKIPILRGGYWSRSENHARCAFRHRRDPGDFGNHTGFRVVVSLVSSGCYILHF
jgi:formylglycine-generating enzyme required for sulfatase activity